MADHCPAAPVHTHPGAPPCRGRQRGAEREARAARHPADTGPGNGISKPAVSHPPDRYHPGPAARRPNRPSRSATRGKPRRGNWPDPDADRTPNRRICTGEPRSQAPRQTREDSALGTLSWGCSLHCLCLVLEDLGWAHRRRHPAPGTRGRPARAGRGAVGRVVPAWPAPVRCRARVDGMDGGDGCAFHAVAICRRRTVASARGRL